MVVLLNAIQGLAAHADIYSFKDASGITHLTNVPTDTRYTLALRESRPPENKVNVSLPGSHAALQRRYRPLVEKAAREHHVDPALLNAVIAVESAFNPRAVSNKGAVGLMQIMPGIARRYGVTDRYDPEENVRAGAGYLRDLMQLYDGDIPLALAAYNAGEDAVARNGNRIPPNRETPSYVMRVMALYRSYQPDGHRVVHIAE